MQTFLPYPDFRKSLECLDLRRLGKQRVESYQILNIITGKAEPNPKTGKIGWISHPCVRMWKGYSDALTIYYNLSLEIWSTRKRKDGSLCENHKLAPIPILDDIEVHMPSWFGLEKFHSSHRSVLLYKDYAFYSQYGWTDDKYASCFWPV
jgi:hypothetical protein